MKALNENEIDIIVSSLGLLEGARLQEVVVARHSCGLGFYAHHEMAWVWIDLNPFRPCLIPINGPQAASVKPARPLLLFLRAHFVGRQLIHVGRDLGLGRAIRFEFAADENEPRELEVRLWPHGQNVSARAGRSHVHFARPAPSEKVSTHERVETNSARTLEVILSEWVESGGRGDKAASPTAKQEKTPQVTAEIQLKKRIEKVESAIKKVEAEHLAKHDNPWREVGEWLAAHQSLAAPHALTTFVDQRKSLAWNIENCFSRAKENDRKILGTTERLAKLKSELAELQSVKDPLSFIEQSTREKSSQAKSGQSKAAHRADKLKMRTLHLSADLRACVGRSGKDNLTLLRSARAWDYWVHLKDFPGSHGILFRDKGAKVSDELFAKVARWLVEATFGEKAKSKAGDRFELLIAECRYVRPIRGDKLGRVTYANERVLAFRF